MRILTRDVHLQASPEAVAAFMLDPAQAPRWLSLIERMEPLDDGPPRQGARYRLVFTAGGQQRVQHTELFEFEPPTRWTHRTQEEGFDARFSYELRAEGPGTQVVFRLALRPATAAAWVVFPFLIRGVRARLSDRLERLKAAMEG